MNLNDFIRSENSSRRAIAWIVVALSTVALTPSDACGQQTGDPVPASSTAGAGASEFVDTFTPRVTDHELDLAAERAWEYRPYRVAVWICHDGSPEINAIFDRIVEDVTRRSELIDPSGWDLSVGAAPSQWRWRFQELIATPKKCEGFENLPMLGAFDKLMIVCLNCDNGVTSIRVREFDLQTQQWGPLLDRQTGHRHQLAAGIMDAISVAFMPLARVDRIIEIDNKDEVFVQARAVNACVRTRLDSDLNWHVVPIKESPVFIKDDDHFLPVIRRTERDGVTLQPLDFTFLTIGNNSGSKLTCAIQSYLRAPLAGRTSKRAEKLALVIRPPERPTRLILKSSSQPEVPLEGVEIWSRSPQAGAAVPSDFLGKTDWRGSFDIPPSSDGLRLIYLKRGARFLKKLPIIPGLYEELTTTVPNDETSLYAEGIILGLEREILNLVVQRNVFETDIAAALEDEYLTEAKEFLKNYQALESPREIKTRMADEEIRLKSMTQDKREIEYISRRFNALRSLLNSEAIKSRETELQEEIQKRSKLTSAG